jgi:IS30 family transposase
MATYDSRRRLAGKCSITTRPTIVGPVGRRPCVLSLVERQTGYLVLGKLRARTVADANRRASPLLRRQPHPAHPLTGDNGTEFHARIHRLSATDAPTKTVTRGASRLPFSARRRKLPMYTQITAAERYTIARLRQHSYPLAAIARLLGRHRSTIYREVRRNATPP